MPPRSKKKKDPAWFAQPVSENDKGLFKRALARYIATEYSLKDGLPHANVETYLAVLPYTCLLYTSPSPRDLSTSRMPSSA